MPTVSRHASLRARSSSRCALSLLMVGFALLAVLRSATIAADKSESRVWTPAQLADGVEAAIARVESSELSTRYIERRNTNAYGSGDAVFASGTGRSLFRTDGTRWYCDDDGFTTRMGKSETTSRRLVVGFDGTTHFEKNRHVVTYGEDNLSVWQHSPGRVFWGAGRDTDFLLGRLRDENAKVVSDETADGRRQVTVAVAWSWGETAYEYRVTLLPNHSFLPVAAAVTVNGNPDAAWSASGLKQTSGLWYPSKVSRKRFVGKKPDRDKRTTITAFNVREDFDDSEFQLESTIGLDIVDRRAGTAFHNDPWWNDLAPFLRKRLNWPQRDMHSANDYAKYGNDDLVGKAAPELSVAEWINGKPTTLSAPDRKLTLLIFFGGRAISPSPRTLAALNNLRDLYHFHGLEVIGIASASDTLDLTRRDVKSLQLRFPVAIDTPNDDPNGNRYGKTFQAYGLKSYYGFFLIDGDGIVRKLRPATDLLRDIGRKPAVGGEFDLRTNVIRILYDAGEKDLNFGHMDLSQLDLPQIRVIEPEWKRLLKSSPRTAKLTGTVTDGQAPIAGATIQAIPTLRLLFSYSPGGYFLSVDRDLRFTFKTDDAGHFDAGGLPKGVWQLTIKKPGHASLEKNVTLETSQSAVELNIENRQKDRIFGRVLDQNGDPIARATVQVDKRHPDPKRPTITTTSHLPKQKAVTDQDGRFEITQLYDGMYTLLVHAADFESTTQPRASANGRELIIRLKPANKTSQITTGFTGYAQIAEQKHDGQATSQPTTPAEPRTVIGMVKDKSGQPVEGAIAVLSTHREASPDQPAMETAAASNKEGRFAITFSKRFLAAAQQQTPEKDRLLCPVTIWAPGRMLHATVASVTKSAEWKTELKPVELVPGHDVTFRVVDPEENPVPDARVRIERVLKSDQIVVPQAIQQRLTASTNAAGIAKFSGLISPRMLIDVGYSSADFQVQRERHSVTQVSSVPRVLRFHRSGTVKGKIRCSVPEAFAQLKLLVTTNHNARIGHELGFPVTRSRSSQVIIRPDAEGKFEVRGLGPGWLQVRQIIDDHTTWRLTRPPVIQVVEPDGVTEFVADLKLGVRIEGFVVDQESGNLLAESTVTISRVVSPQVRFMRNRQETISLQSESDGRFQTLLLPGVYQVAVRTMVPGFSRIRVHRVDVKPDQDHLQVKVQVPRTLSMQAELVDEDDLPIGDAWVAAMAGSKVLMLKRASDIGIFEAWLADVARADSWQVRIGKRRLQGTVVKKVPLKLQVSLQPEE